jgi:hypothetical protein
VEGRFFLLLSAGILCGMWQYLFATKGLGRANCKQPIEEVHCLVLCLELVKSQEWGGDKKVTSITEPLPCRQSVANPNP